MLPKLKISNCAVLLVGSIIQAIGIYNIHALADVTEGGVLGLTLLLQHWLQISPAISSLILNLVCYAIGWRTLGRDFIGYSLISICIYSMTYGFLEQFPPFWPEIAQAPLLAAIAVAAYTLIGRTVRRTASTTAYTYVVYAVCAAALLAISFVQRQNLFAYGPSAILVGLLLAVFSTIMGHSIFNWCLKFFTPSFVSASKLCIPITSAVFAFLAFGEVPTLLQVLGCLVILAGMCWYYVIESKEKGRENEKNA